MSQHTPTKPGFYYGKGKKDAGPRPYEVRAGKLPEHGLTLMGCVDSPHVEDIEWFGPVPSLVQAERIPVLEAALKRAVPWLGRAHAEGAHLQTVAPNDLMGAIHQAEAALKPAGT